MNAVRNDHEAGDARTGHALRAMATSALVLLVLVGTQLACRPKAKEVASPTPPSAHTAEPTLTPTHALLPTHTPTITATPAPTRTPTPVPPTATPMPSTTTSPPSVALELGDEEVRNERGGYALRYPEGWQVVTIDGETFVFKNEDAFDTLSVPIIWVKGGSLETLTDGDMAGAQNAQEMIQALVDRNRRQGENFEFGQVQAGNVAGERSAFVNCSWSEEGLLLAGRVVAIHLDERGILIMGTGTVETWEPFIPTFEAVLASMTLFEPVPMPTIDVYSVLAITRTPTPAPLTVTPTPESFSQASP